MSSEIKMKTELLKPENLRIDVLSASKRTEIDNYENGCSGGERETDLEHKPSYPNVLDAYRDIAGDPELKAEHIQTFDPNIYCDLPKGGHKTVANNRQKGNFRCLFDRMENTAGKVPSADEMKRFKAGEINLRCATYELLFHVRVVNVEEDVLAQVLDVNNHS